MYGTTIRSYNESKNSKFKKTNVERSSSCSVNNKKITKKNSKKEQDTKYIKLDSKKNTSSFDIDEENQNLNETFSFKDLPIVSVVITVIFTMMMLVMTSGFGGL